MSYQPLNYDYTVYTNHILNILKKPVEQLDFLSNLNTFGIFGVSSEFGMDYCRCIQEEFPEEVRKIHEGVYDTHLAQFQSIGTPQFFFSTILDRYMTGNTTRYIYHALIIKKYMEEKFSGKPLQVLEIGGGYGGLCFWLSKLAPQSIKTYEICDLNAAVQLQTLCLGKWNVPCSFLENPFAWKKHDTTFVISNYGFAEFNDMFQKVYTQTILSQCDGGFMVWNNPTGLFKFTENLVKIEKERPVFPPHNNMFLYF
jgi:hypothetical protein